MTTIDSQYIRVFCTLARHLNMSRAAQDLRLTPSGISHGVRALESDLGCRLFERTSRKMSLTPAGLEFRAEAEAILERMTTARSKLRSWKDGRCGGLRIAASAAACQFILPMALQEFRKKFPGILVQIDSCTGHQAAQLIQENNASLALIVEPAQAAGLHFISLAEDELQFFVHPTHPWTKRGAGRDIAQQNLILPPRHSETHSLIKAYFEREDVRVKPFIEIGDEEAVKQLVRLNLGVGFLPRWIAAAEIQAGLLTSLPLGRRHLRRRWGILHSSSHELTSPESVLTGLCRNVAETLMKRVEE